MTISGSGVGGNIGGPQITLQDDSRKTAETEYNKQYLGIVKDAIEQSFTEANPKYSRGFFGRYMSTESRPMLDHPLESLRADQGFDAIPDETWKTFQEELIKLLPNDIQKQLSQESKKNIEDRDGIYIALGNVLRFVAKFLSKLDELSQPIPANSIAMSRTHQNQIMPLIALKQFADNGMEIQQSALDHILERGPNYYHFDGLHNFLNEVKQALNNMQQLAAEFNGGGSLQTIARITELASVITSLNANLQKAAFKDELQMLRPTLYAMEIITSAWSLANSGSPSFFIGLSIATIGINGDKNSSGIFGNAFSKIIGLFSQGIVSSLIPQSNEGQEKFANLFLTVGIAALIGLTSLGVESGFGPLPKSDITHANSIGFLAIELGLLIMQSSGTLQTVVKTFFNAIGVEENKGHIGAEVISQGTTLLQILAATSGSKKDPAYLMETQENYLENGIAAGVEMANKGASEEYTDAANVALHQFQTAFEEKNYGSIIEIFNSLLENLGTSIGNLMQDIKTIIETTHVITNNSSIESSEQSMTGIVNIV